jgi:hypothetical protein
MRTVHTIMLADDMVLVASSPQQLQEQLVCLSAVASKLRFEVSAKKTEIVVCRPTGSSPPIQECTLRSFLRPNSDSPRVTVPVVDKSRYLGVTLTLNLNWQPHISRMLAVASRRASAVRSMVHNYNVAEAWLARTVAYCNMSKYGPHP